MTPEHVTIDSAGVSFHVGFHVAFLVDSMLKYVNVIFLCLKLRVYVFCE